MSASRRALEARKEKRLQQKICDAILDQERNGCPLRIRELRLKAGMTLEQLANELLVARSTLASWERGDTTPSADYAFDICCALHVEPNDLFRGFSKYGG